MPTIVAQALGIANGAFKYAVNYDKNRKSLIRRSIIDYQSLQLLMAALVTQIEAERSLLYRTTTMYDEFSENISLFLYMCKLFSTDTVIRVTADSAKVIDWYRCNNDFFI